MDDALEGWDPPILGEPVPIELANTRYRDGDVVIDFLPTAATADRWFAMSPTAAALERPGRWTRSGWSRLIELRDVIDDLLRARIAGKLPDRSLVARLNESARLVTTTSEMTWRDAHTIELFERLTANDRADAVVGTIAHQAIRLLTGTDARLLRICAHDDCQMLFLKHHHRRRWCHNSCGHRHRQAKYYHSHHRHSRRPMTERR
jgi:predicted RNA-binding Zn ribbon-like protein